MERGKIPQLDEKQFSADLATLVAYDTSRKPPAPGAPFGMETAQALHAFLQLAAGYGFRVKNIANYCGYVEYGTGEAMVALLGHLDVVPAGDLKEWQTPPFTLTIKGEKLLGRGVIDNKGPVLLALHALKALKEGNVKLQKRLRLIVGCAEESGCECIARYKKTEELPQYVITPDADYPGIIGEKGVLNISIHKKLRPGNPLLSMQVGSVINAVPGYATATVEGKKYEAFGKAAHGSKPEEGDNALVKLCTKLRQSYKHEFLELMQFVNAKGLNVDLKDAYSALTLVPSLAQVDKEQAQVKCDIRFPITLQAEDVVRRIRARVEDLGFTLTVLSSYEPLYIEPESALAKGLLKTYQQCTGDTTTKQQIIGGGTYAKTLPNTMAFGAMFPGEIPTEHTAAESWSMDKVRKNYEIFLAAIKTLDNL